MIISKNLSRVEFVQLFCDVLTKWVTNEKDVSFFTKKTKQTDINCGDIVPTRNSVNWLTKLHFTIKYGYKNASFDKHFIPNTNDTMYNLWKTAKNKAGDDTPVMIYKNPHTPSVYIFISYDLYEHIMRDVISCNMLKLRYFDLGEVYVFELNDFLDKVKYKKLKKAVNQL